MHAEAGGYAKNHIEFCSCGTYRKPMKPLFYQSSLGVRIAYQQQPGEGVGVVFLHGWRSEMSSTKASALGEFCAANNISLTRFDYFAHGASEGDFLDFTLGRALTNVLEVLDQLAPGPQIIVGSSMGGWLGLLAAKERREQIVGLVGIAAAPDFTVPMLHQKMTSAQREEIEREGVIWMHSDFNNNDYPLTLAFIRDGNAHALLDHPIPLEIPIHLIQGQQDDSVPWETALAIADRVIGKNVTVTLIKDGDHRLNREEDLSRMYDAVLRIRGV